MLYEFFRLPISTRDELLWNVEVVGRGTWRPRTRVAAASSSPAPTSATGSWRPWCWPTGAYAAPRGRGRPAQPLAHAGGARDQERARDPHRSSHEDGFRKLLRALEHNELVALMVDGDLYRHGDTVELLRARDALADGPGRARAAHRGARSICGYCERVATRQASASSSEPTLDPAELPDRAALNHGDRGHLGAPHPRAPRSVVHLPAAVGTRPG